MRIELSAPVALLIAAVAYYAVARAINRSALADDFGAAGLPVVYAYLLGVFSVAWLIKIVISNVLERRAASPASGAEAGASTARALGLLGIGIGYMILVTYVGYLPTIVALLWVVAASQGEPVGRRLVFVAVGGGLAFFVFFVVLLGVDMPGGAWLSVLSR